MTALDPAGEAAAAWLAENDAPAAEPSGGDYSPPAPGTDDEPEASTFDRIDLADVVNGDYAQPTPDLLTRHDGRSLFYSGQVNGAHGDSGSGKGWIVCLAVAQAIRDGSKVMLLDLEDVPGSIVARLRLLGLSDAQIVHGLDYRRPTEPFTVAAVEKLRQDLLEGGHALVVVDSLGEAFALSGVDEDKDAQVGPWLRSCIRPLADTGAAVVLVDHSTKANDNPLHPSGSKRKRAAIGGASYHVEATQPLKKGQGGRLKLTCAKDRHGTYARGEVVANYVMSASDDDHVDVQLYAPDAPAGEAAAAEILVLAQKVIRTVRDSETPHSKKTLLAMIQGRAERRRAALDYAINSGCLAIDIGKHGAHLLRYVRDLEVGK